MTTHKLTRVLPLFGTLLLLVMQMPAAWALDSSAGDPAPPALGSQENQGGADNGSVISNLIKSIENLRYRIAVLDGQVNTLQTQLASVQANSVLQLDRALTLHTVHAGRPTVLFTGVNVQIVNGAGSTDRANGLGNLIVGYDEPNPRITPKRSGSHNIVLGPYHEYTSYGGLVAGIQNTISGPNASVCGGYANTASGDGSSVGGGEDNHARNLFSHVSGGVGNTADGVASSVLGGYLLNATAFSQTIPTLP